MKATPGIPSTCQNCQFFTPHSHQNGYCSKLDAMVNGEWLGCALGSVAFESENRSSMYPIDRILNSKITLARSQSIVLAKDPNRASY